MYIEIKGTDRLSINNSLKIKGRKESYRLIDKNNVKLNMYGLEYIVKLDWLYHLTRSRTTMPKGFEQYITRVSFKKTDTRLRSADRYPMLMHFIEPVYFTKDLRIIAEFPNYAISKDKKIYSILEKKYLNILEKADDNELYPKAYLKTKYAEKEWIQIGVHILAATTWIENDDYLEKPFVNHKNGNKNDWNIDNLEWTSQSGNLVHAFQSGLRGDNIEIKMYDKELKMITLFSSIREAFKAMGAKTPRSNIEDLFRERNGCYIAKNRYEIRYKNDKTNFLLKTKTLEEIRKMFSRKNEFYQAINVKTNDTLNGTPKEISEMLNMSESGVRNLRLKKTIYKDWIIREYSDEPVNLKDFRKAKFIPVKIIGVRLSDNKEYVFDSLRKAAETIGCDRATIQKYISNPKRNILTGIWGIKLQNK